MMLICRDVTTGYAKKEIVHGVSFTAAPGEITVILGKNGCGKTTLLRAVSGALPYRGSITVDGCEVRGLRAAQRARRMALMPQMLKSPDVTVRELVGFGRQPYTGVTGVLSAADREIVERMIAKTGLEPLAEQRLGSVSGGERQKAYLAMLLAQDTPLLLLDEPGAHLDMAYRKQLGALLKEEKRGGKAIVAVLHDLNRALELADRILAMREGRLLFDGTPAAFCDSALPGELFGLVRYRCTGPDGGEGLPVFR